MFRAHAVGALRKAGGLNALGFLQFVLQHRLSQIPLPLSCLEEALQDIDRDECKPSAPPFWEPMCEHFQDLLLDALYRKPIY